MRISTKGRYALRMMLDLAQHRESGFVALKDIAARQDISKKYLEQIVPVLNKSRISFSISSFLELNLFTLISKSLIIIFITSMF